jgi:hypothetical protein
MSYRTSKCNRVSKNSVEAGDLEARFRAAAMEPFEEPTLYPYVFLKSGQAVCFIGDAKPSENGSVLVIEIAGVTAVPGSRSIHGFQFGLSSLGRHPMRKPPAGCQRYQ